MEREEAIECESCGKKVTDKKWVNYEGKKYCYECIDSLPRDM